MNSTRTLVLSITWALLSAPLVGAQDLSRYREFQIGMNLAAVAKLANEKPSEAKMVHQRPAVIQELEWQPQRFLSSSPQTDPVKEVLFSFYNGELFRMSVTYDWYRTGGLTSEDVVEAIAAIYGTAARPTAQVIRPSSQLDSDNEKVVARWEDSQYSLQLLQPSYPPTFRMVLVSKRLESLAGAAVAEALRLDEQEAPQREIERQKKQVEQEHAEGEKARLVNKPTFRP
jgi:hypothetical protein